MSVIVAYRKDGIVYVGADTQTTCNGDISRSSCGGGFKLHRFDSGLIAGFCGRVTTKQQILASGLFEFGGDIEFNKKYIVYEILPKLYEVMKESGCLEKDSELNEMQGSILLAYKDKIYYINSKFSVNVYDRFYAIGAGRSACFYALSRLDESKDVNEQLLNVLRISAKYESTVSAPFVLIDTGEKQFKIVEG